MILLNLAADEAGDGLGLSVQMVLDQAMQSSVSHCWKNWYAFFEAVPYVPLKYILAFSTSSDVMPPNMGTSVPLATCASVHCGAQV